MKATARLLIAEDSQTQVYLINTIIAKIPELDIVGVAEDGVQALSYLRREPPYDQAVVPDLLLLDINMPKKNGFEVLEEIKADPILKSLPVVMLTTSSSEADVDQAYKSGASGFITKPVGFDELRQVLEAFANYWTSAVELPPNTFNLSP